MPNTQRTQSSQDILNRRLPHKPEGVTTVGVWQDNPAPNPARVASPQPAPPRKDLRAQKMNTPHDRSQNPPKKMVHLTVWVKPRVKAELQRIAGEERLSVSSV